MHINAHKTRQSQFYLQQPSETHLITVQGQFSGQAIRLLNHLLESIKELRTFREIQEYL